MKKVILYIIVLIAITWAARACVGTFDTPIVYKSNSTGKLHMVTKASYPRILSITKDELPTKYSLIYTK